MRETKKQMLEDDHMHTCSNCNGRNACNMCGSYSCGPEHHKYLILRWLLGLLILVFTFWLGAKVGEFKSMYMNDEFGGNYGRHFMMRAYPNAMFSDSSHPLITPGTPEAQLQTLPASNIKPATPSKTLK